MNGGVLTAGDLVVYTGPVDDAGLSTFEGLSLNSNKFIRIKAGAAGLFVKYSSTRVQRHDVTQPQIVLFEGEPYFFRAESWSKAAHS